MSASLADAVKALLPMVPPSWDDQRAAPNVSDNRVPVRNASVKGPLAPNGDWVMEKAGASAATIAITRVPNSDDVTYEIVNFIDGRRSVSDIRNAVSAEFTPIDLKAVAEYIDVLDKAGAVTFKK
jgi:hypothetical protein